MVVAAQELRTASRFVHRRAAELAAPDHQGFVQQPTPLQVREQRRDRPVDLLALLGQVLDDVVAGAGAVAVPAPVVELDVAHAALDQAAGQQAVVGERRRPRLGAVLLHDRFRLLADVHHVGNRHLHAESQLVLADPRQGLRIAELGELVLVELPQGVQACGDGRRDPSLWDR